MTKTLKFEILGIFFVLLLGSFLHFAFEFSGKFWLVGVFSPVNESVWEHLKLAFFPSILWLLIEIKFLKEKPKNFLFAKTKGIFLIPFLIVVLFYSFEAILGKDVLILDILIFIVSVILGTILGLKIMSFKNVREIFNKISAVFLFLFFVCFVIFTFYPPKLFLFQDPITQGYGIQKSNLKRIKIGENVFLVELAITKKQKEKGLGERDFLPEKHGMLFVFEKPDFYYFWMKGMKFPLDFVWILEDRVVDITENVLPQDFQPPNSFTSKFPADKVLEVKAGTVKKANIQIGDKVEFL
ncbi:DUF192 domain-containing protein, partial [Candidatus Parcubacteria bacterium]|nr:DUF192 domain-containing protein [Candidatus Parcubacteria bacterium]